MASARYLALFGVAVSLLVTAGGGCQRPVEENRVVHVRIDDLLYSESAPTPGSTAFYPKRTLADETRVVLRGAFDGSAVTPRQDPIAVDLDVPQGAVLELGYGLGKVEAGTGAEFTVSARTPQKTVQLFRAQLQADAKEPGSAAWHDARVDLGALSGPVTLEFMAISDRLATAPERDGVSPYAFFSAPVITKPAATEAPRHVVLISIDTLRADRLGIYGYDKNTSPNIDRIFGERGTIVERFYTNAVDTLSGHASMMTGLLPETALRPADPLRELGAWTSTLAEAFRTGGFRTAAFTENAWVAANFGFWRGFETYQEDRGAVWLKDTPGHAEAIFRDGLSWLTAHRGEPAFLFLHTYETHYPYTPKAPTSPADDSPSAIDSANYDAEIRYVDELLGRFFASLEKQGMLENTVIVLTSDHGEQFGEHGRRYHGNDIYEETLRVPALFYAPKLLPVGLRRLGPMSIVDLKPTLLELFGFPKPTDLDGESFAAHLRDGAEVHPIAIYHEAVVPIAMTYEGGDTTWIPPSYSVTTWPYRMTRIRTPEGTRYELYDLVTDPGEKTNIYDKMGKRFGFRQARIDRYVEFRSGRRDELAQKIKRDGAPVQPAEPQVDPAIAEKLRALGYVE